MWLAEQGDLYVALSDILGRALKFGIKWVNKGQISMHCGDVSNIGRIGSDRQLRCHGGNLTFIKLFDIKFLVYHLLTDQRGSSLALETNLSFIWPDTSSPMNPWTKGMSDRVTDWGLSKRLTAYFLFQGFPKTVQVLLESGAHINCQTTAGETALMRVSG